MRKKLYDRVLVIILFLAAFSISILPFVFQKSELMTTAATQSANVSLTIAPAPGVAAAEVPAAPVPSVGLGITKPNEIFVDFAEPIYVNMEIVFRFYYTDENGQKKPLADGKIAVYRLVDELVVKEGVTDADGNFKFIPSETGRYEIKAAKEGFYVFKKEFEVITPIEEIEKPPLITMPSLEMPGITLKPDVLRLILVCLIVILAVLPFVYAWKFRAKPKAKSARKSKKTGKYRKTKKTRKTIKQSK